MTLLYLKENVDIYFTGSNAYVLSGELAPKLTGRYIEVNMLPLSFGEFVEGTGPVDRRESFRQFVDFGGFLYAALFVEDSFANSQYLEGAYNTVLVKNAMSRKKLTDGTLRNMILGSRGKDIGHVIENVVYLELRRRGYSVNIGKADRGECLRKCSVVREVAY